MRGERSLKPFMDKDDELVHVILPLSSDLYLLGETDISQPSPSQNLPLEIARCSMKYFICSHQSDLSVGFQTQIGRNASWLSAREMSVLLGEVLSGLVGQKLT